MRVWCRSTAGDTLTIFGGQAIPFVANAAPCEVDFKHALFAASGAGVNAQLVFTGTDSFSVHNVKTGSVCRLWRRIAAVGAYTDTIVDGCGV